jgi:hypothetical protein
VAEIEQIRDAVIGSSGDVISEDFVYALRSWTRGWYLDVFTVRAENGRVRSFYWVLGNLLGHLTEKGDDANPAITGGVASISNIKAAEITAKVSKTSDGGVGHRVLIIRLGAGDDLVIDTSADQPSAGGDPDRFIDYVLDRIGGTAESSRP